MAKVKDKNYMDILLKADTVIIESKGCKVLERCFHIDGTTLFIMLEEIEKINNCIDEKSLTQL